ncbi:hypothetical protein H696_05200 [Fonticula alba]|uniref:Alpha-mannosidase n=1 Tax=Fonticula alba TaxID=691883 RepID=A0A058Z1W4_FONAL|nr:hypothetical protein H696_05200 [Fonticula alba]KCV68279.1 hypothetical protein H696_05200 [Fonticula alba]|eukprot:XP_009497333.1 hypothetical protein H696_05200 [Fonticula alba]
MTARFPLVLLLALLGVAGLLLAPLPRALGALYVPQSSLLSSSARVVHQDGPLSGPVGKVLSSGERVPLEVWVVPHSHDDVGWRMTADEYYVQQVKKIYDTTVDALSRNPSRKFIVVEMAFFSRWYREATDAQRKLVHSFVANGQMEFILAGWVMSDNANPTYSANIDQMTEGLQWPYETLGVVPVTSWNIDPFGLSAVYPTLFAKMGFKGGVINRITYSDKDLFKATQHMEFVWRGSKSLGAEVELFTHVLSDHYSSPSGFDFERDQPITPHNVASKANTLVREFARRAAGYRTQHLLIPAGDDFRYQNAHAQFDSWDLLIDYINANSEQLGVRIRYSTLSDYFEALARETAVTWPLFTGDFYPYADNELSWWTGYFTSYPQFKRLVRTTEGEMRAVDMLSQAAAAQVGPARFQHQVPSTHVSPLRQAHAVAQHHDAVTGTSKAYVMEDYVQAFAEAEPSTRRVFANTLAVLLGGDATPAQLMDLDLAGRLDRLAPGGVVPVVIANSLAWPRHTVHTLPLDRSDVVVRDADGALVPSQVIPALFDEPSLGRLPYELAFEARLPAAGYRVYFVEIAPLDQVSEPRSVLNADTPLTLRNEAISLAVTPGQRNLAIVQTDLLGTAGQTVSKFAAELRFYRSVSTQQQNSGAYIFRPMEDIHLPLDRYTEVTLVEGPVFSEVRAFHNREHVLALRLHHVGSVADQAQVHVDSRLGEIPYNTEVVVHIATDLADTVFISDNNALEMHARRPYDGSAPQKHFYPIVSQAVLRSEADGTSVAFLTDRAVAGASLGPGAAEFMLHRRCSRDDGRGVAEALNDRSVIRSRLTMHRTGNVSMDRTRAQLNIINMFPPLLAACGPAAANATVWEVDTPVFSMLQAPLPDSVHLLTVKADASAHWRTGLLRLQNIFEVDAGLPEEVIDATQVLDFGYSLSEELDLCGINTADHYVRPQWADDSGSVHVAQNPLSVLMRPMDIRTWRYKLSNPY